MGVAWYQATSGLWLQSERRNEHRIHLAMDGDPLARGPVALLRELPTSFDQMAIFVTEAELGLPTSGLSQIQEGIKRVGFEWAARATALLAAWIDDLPLEREAQLDFASKVFSLTGVVERLRELLSPHARAVVLSDQQLTALARLVVLEARPERMNTEPSEREGLLLERLALATSAVAGIDASTRMTSDRARDWLPFLIRNGAFNSTEPLLEAVGRTASLLERAESPDARTRHDFCDLDRWAAETSRISLRQQLAAGFAVMASSDAISNEEPTAATGLLGPGYLESIADRLALGAGGADALRDLLSADRSWYAARFTELEQRFALDPRDAASGYNRTPFEQRPFLRLADGRLLLWSPRAMASWITDGFYYRALDAARLLGKREHFLTFWGYLVEEFVLDLLRSAHSEPRPVGSGRVFGESMYGPRSKRKATCDVALDFGADLVVIEVCSGRLSLEARIAGGPDKVATDIAKMTAHKARQLSRRIDDYLNGEFDYPGVERSHVRRIWPVVVTGPGLSMSEVLWDELQQRLRGALQQARVRPLTILDLADLDQVIGLVEGGWSVPELLERKTGGYLRLDWRRMVSEDPNMSAARAPQIVSRWDQASNRMIQDLGWDPEEYDERRRQRAA